MDSEGRFKEDNFAKAMAATGDNASDEATSSKRKKRTDRGEDSDIFKLASVLIQRNLDPVRRCAQLCCVVLPAPRSMMSSCYT